MAKNIVTISGGKDSQAAALWAKNNLDKFEMVFNDVKWESAITYTHLQYMEAMFNQKLVIASSSKYDGMLDLVAKKGRFPSTKARFCTEELKVKPMIDYILTHTEDLVIYVGVRAEESESRRNLSPTDDFFKFYFEPYKWVGKYDKQIKKLQQRLSKSNAGNTQSLGFISDGVADELRALVAKNQSTLKPVYHTYRKKDIIAWCDKYEAEVRRPILKWSTENVFDYIAANGQYANPLYKRGSKRVGCYPCVMCTLDEIETMAQQDPARIDEIEQYEQVTNSTFFPPDYIPERFCTKVVVLKNGKTRKVPTIRDVIKYVVGNPDQAKLSLKQNSCISPYAICE